MAENVGGGLTFSGLAMSVHPLRNPTSKTLLQNPCDCMPDVLLQRSCLESSCPDVQAFLASHLLSWGIWLSAGNSECSCQMNLLNSKFSNLPNQNGWRVWL